MTVYKRGRIWRFRRMMDGRVYDLSLHIRAGQEQLLSDAVREMDLRVTAQHLGLPYQRQASMSFNAFCPRFLRAQATRVSPAELEKQSRRLEVVKALWGTRELRQIGREDVARLERHLLRDRGVGETTCNRYFEIVRSLYRLAIADGYARESPTQHYLPYQEGATRTALTADELRRVIDAAAVAAKTPRAPNWRPILDMVVFALHTGARLSEILELRLEWIRDGAAFIPIQKTKSRRRSNRRAAAVVKTIPLNAVAASAVERNRGGRSEGYVFPLQSRHPDSVRLAVLRIRELSKVPAFGFHVLRHTFVTEASGRLGATAAQALVSHSDLKTTARYSHPRLAEIKAASTILSAALPGYPDESSGAV